MTRLWIHLLVVPVGTALGTFSIFRALLVGPFIAVPMLLVALAATGWVSWWSSATLSVAYRVACCAASVIVVFLSGRSLGNDMAISALRAEVPLVLREIALRKNAEGSFKITNASYLRRVNVTTGPQDEGIRATFGLPSGTVVTYMSSARHWHAVAKRKCTAEIQPGWYWHGRCE